MKKGIAILLCILLLLMGVSCQDEDARPDQEAAESLEAVVYVSRAGKIHSNPYCSGMLHYKKMSMEKALGRGCELCKNCYR